MLGFLVVALKNPARKTYHPIVCKRTRGNTHAAWVQEVHEQGSRFRDTRDHGTHEQDMQLANSMIKQMESMTKMEPT